MTDAQQIAERGTGERQFALIPPVQDREKVLASRMNQIVAVVNGLMATVQRMGIGAQGLRTHFPPVFYRAKITGYTSGDQEFLGRRVYTDGTFRDPEDLTIKAWKFPDETDPLIDVAPLIAVGREAPIFKVRELAASGQTAEENWYVAFPFIGTCAATPGESAGGLTMVSIWRTLLSRFRRVLPQDQMQKLLDLPCCEEDDV